MYEEENEILSGLKKQSLIKRLTIIGQLTRFMIYLAAFIPLVICVILAIFASSGVFNALEIKSGSGGIIYLGRWYDFIIIGIVISTAIYGIYNFFRLRRERKIDERFPDFVRDIAEYRRAGMNFTKAIMYASEGNYGFLTDEIKKIAMQISWGSSIEDALDAFAKRVNTKLICRTVSLIIEASRSGGNVADFLDAASKDAREIKLLEYERRARMHSYVAIIYVAMIVVLVSIVFLSKTLIPNMLTEASAGLAGMVSIGTGSSLKASDVSMLFFWAVIMQGGLMGIVAGIFEEGYWASGVKHSFVMILLSWLIFKFIIGNV